MVQQLTPEEMVFLLSKGWTPKRICLEKWQRIVELLQAYDVCDGVPEIEYDGTNCVYCYVYWRCANCPLAKAGDRCDNDTSHWRRFNGRYIQLSRGLEPDLKRGKRMLLSAARSMYHAIERAAAEWWD